MISHFELERPTTIADALEVLAVGGTPYCGGTELLAVMRMGLVKPQILIDLKRVEELAGIIETDDEIQINARVSHRESSACEAIQRHASVLSAATAQLGNARVRSTGTLAGNICFAEPRSDVLTALLALNAHVDLRSKDGSCSVCVDDFVEGAFTTTRNDTELLQSIRISKIPSRGMYLRFQPTEYPTVTVTIVDRSPHSDCRVVVGAVGDRPELFTFSNLGEVDAESIGSQVRINEDLNGKEDYKRHLATVFIRRATDNLRKMMPSG